MTLNIILLIIGCSVIVYLTTTPYRSEIKRLKNTVDNVETELADFRDENGNLKKTLSFYADEKTWQETFQSEKTYAEVDGGNFARFALKLKENRNA